MPYTSDTWNDFFWNVYCSYCYYFLRHWEYDAITAHNNYDHFLKHNVVNAYMCVLVCVSVCREIIVLLLLFIVYYSFVWDA